MTWKAVGVWVVVERIQSTGNSGIVQVKDNIGKVVSSNYPELENKTIIYNNYNRINSHKQFAFVKYEDIMGVQE